MLQESGEMYLETILRLKKKLGNVRSVDIVEELDYSKSSVSRAVNILKSEGYICIDKDGDIKFTKTGEEYSKAIYERHQVLTMFLTYLGVSDKVAEDDACRIEHVISNETLECIEMFLANNHIDND